MWHCDKWRLMPFRIEFSKEGIISTYLVISIILHFLEFIWHDYYMENWIWSPESFITKLAYSIIFHKHTWYLVRKIKRKIFNFLSVRLAITSHFISAAKQTYFLDVTTVKRGKYMRKKRANWLSLHMIYSFWTTALETGPHIDSADNRQYFFAQVITVKEKDDGDSCHNLISCLLPD